VNWNIGERHTLANLDYAMDTDLAIVSLFSGNMGLSEAGSRLLSFPPLNCKKVRKKITLGGKS
jgi:hypothetical protein